MQQLFFNTLIICCCVVIGLIYPYFKRKDFVKKDVVFLQVLWIYHLLFAFIYTLYASFNSSDSVNYWRTPIKNTLHDLIYTDIWGNGVGTKTMFVLNYPTSNLLQFSFLSANVFYSLIAFVGFTIFYKLLIVDNANKLPRIFGISLFNVVIFFPNIHFWTANVGKDTIMFTTLMVIVNSIINKRYYSIGLVLSVLLIMLIRPPIFFILVLSATVALLLDKSVKAINKVLLVSVLIVFLFSIAGVVQSFVHIDNISINAIQQAAEARAKYLQEGQTGSAVDISSYPFIFKIFTFLFRPLFIDSPNVLGLLSSMENLILILLFIIFFQDKILRRFKFTPWHTKTLLFYFILATIMFSITLGNLGIMLRFKNMVLPFFFLFMARSYNIRLHELK